MTDKFIQLLGLAVIWISLAIAPPDADSTLAGEGKIRLSINQRCDGGGGSFSTVTDDGLSHPMTSGQS